MLNITHKSLLISCVIGVLTAIFLIVFPSLASARVTGVCSNCHTMHNSQNGTAMAKNYLNADLPPQDQLLTSDCVGCHSSSTGDTIVILGTSRIPIVYNTSGYPLKPLAGGNFYWVAQGDDTKGHNVYGINGPDPNLTSGAPGHTNDGCGTGKCHSSLADPPQGSNWQLGGCRGCHVFTGCCPNQFSKQNHLTVQINFSEEVIPS